MSTGNGSISCAMGCWLVALLGGVLAAILLGLLGTWTFLQAVFAGLVIAAVAGVLLSLIMCRALPAVSAASDDAPSDADAKAAAEAKAAADAKAKSEAVTTPPPVAAQTEAAAKSKAKAAPAAKPAPKPKAEKAPKAATNPEPVTGGTKPETLSAARNNAPDDLKQIKGVGPKLEGVLHSMGYFHFDQIAAWGPDEIAWADQNLVGFKGRVSRDDWVPQAKTLAEGGTTEFSKKVKKGDVY